MFRTLRRFATVTKVWLLCAALVLANTWGVLHASAHGTPHEPRAESIDQGHSHRHVGTSDPTADCDHATAEHDHWLDALLGHAQTDESCALFDQLSPGSALPFGDNPSVPAPEVASQVGVEVAHQVARFALCLPPARGPPRLT